MKYIFFLSGDYIELGREEIISLFNDGKHKSDGMMLVSELNIKEKEFKKEIKRLALTKNVYKFLFECKNDDLTEFMKNYDWNSVYKDSFCLRIEKLYNNDRNTITKNFIDGKYKKINFKKFSEKNLAGYIWQNVNNPEVNLSNPKILIQLFIINDKVYCGLLIYSNNEDFESRKSHLRPFPHPRSLHPKVARALINITGIREITGISENEILLDPFCGTGGFLIEAGLMNIKSVGYDINKIMTKGCIENLKHYNVKNYKIKNQNALKINDEFGHVVTDLPYGLNSNAMMGYEKDWKKHRINKKIETKNFIKNLESFYLKFLKTLRKKLKKKAVIVFPSYVNYKKLLKQSKFKIEFEFTNYVHGSLMRKMVKVI